MMMKLSVTVRKLPQADDRALLFCLDQTVRRDLRRERDKIVGEIEPAGDGADDAA